jgi:predicted dehydrogenase
MAISKLRVGLVGANADYGWSPRAHVPALKALSDSFALTAVCTAHPETAAASAERFEVPYSFSDHRDLLSHSEIDVVVVSVKVPIHHSIVMDSLQAGKHVYTEWPMAANVTDAEEMATLARNKGVQTMVGLQARSSPGYLYLKELIEEGFVGEVLSCTLKQFGGGTGGTLQRNSDRRWQADRRQGANTLTIQFGHVLDIFCHCLGSFAELSAQVSTQIPQWYEPDTGQMVEVDSPDNVMISGHLQNGAAASLHSAAVPHFPNGLHLEIHGRKGTIVVTQSQMAQFSPVHIKAAREGESQLLELTIPDKFYWVSRDIPPGPPFNVAQAYTRFAESILGNHPVEPNFDTGLNLHKLLAMIEKSSTEGQRIIL